MKVLVIDNYDSFVYNLFQYIGELGGETVVYRNHQVTPKQVMKLKPDRIVIFPAESLDDKEIMGVRHVTCPIEGVQFHPESILTEDGKVLIRNFLEGR